MLILFRILVTCLRWLLSILHDSCLDFNVPTMSVRLRAYAEEEALVAAKICSMYDASSKHLYLLSLILAIGTRNDLLVFLEVQSNLLFLSAATNFDFCRPQQLLKNINNDASLSDRRLFLLHCWSREKGRTHDNNQILQYSYVERPWVSRMQKREECFIALSRKYREAHFFHAGRACDDFFVLDVQ